MIAHVSIGLAAVEALAITTKRVPKISRLSHTFPWSLLIWGWMIWLAVHFISEARTAITEDYARHLL